MPLFELPQTDAEKRAMEIFQKKMTDFRRSVYARFMDIQMFIWREAMDRYGVDPQRFFDILGPEDSLKLFALSDRGVAMLNLCGENIDRVVPEGISYTLSTDTGVTITGMPEPPPPDPNP